MQDLIVELRKLADEKLTETGKSPFIELTNQMEQRNRELKRFIREQARISEVELTGDDVQDMLGELILKLTNTSQDALDNAAEARLVIKAFMELTTPGAKDWLTPPAIIEMIHTDSVKSLNSDKPAGRELRNQFTEIGRMVNEFEKTAGDHHYYGGDGLAKRLHRLISHYNMTAANALATTKSFRDDMLTWLRAMSLVGEMAGNAGTHAEKNARLRGMVELIESAIQKIQNQRMEFNYRWWNHEDIFKSDYPVRQFVDRIHELERENESLKQQQNGHSEPA